MHDIDKQAARARMAAAHRSFYSAGGATVELAVPQPDQLAWTDGYLTPYVCAPSRAPALSVVLSTDVPMLAEVLERLAAGSSPSIVPFYLYRHAARYRFADGVALVPLPDRIRQVSVDAPLPAREVYVLRERELVAFIEPTQRDAPIPEIARIVRDAITKEFLARGELLLHASAIGSAGIAFAFSGEKGAGKSTVLLSALRKLPVKLIANDRAHVHWQEQDVVLRNWPTANCFFLHSLEDNGIRIEREFSPAYPQRPFWNDTGRPDPARKVGLLTTELAGLFGAAPEDRGRLRHFFLISRGGSTRGRVVACNDPTDAYTFLSTQRFDMSESQYPDPFEFARRFQRSNDAAEDALLRLCRSSSVQFYQVFGSDTSFAILEFLERMLAETDGSATSPRIQR